jgi:predicted RNA polymerase sigma factor
MIDFDSLYRAESRRVLATLIRLLGDFELAEDTRALELTLQAPERRFLERRLGEVSASC